MKLHTMTIRMSVCAQDQDPVVRALTARIDAAHAAFGRAFVAGNWAAYDAADNLLRALRAQRSDRCKRYRVPSPDDRLILAIFGDGDFDTGLTAPKGYQFWWQI